MVMKELLSHREVNVEVPILTGYTPLFIASQTGPADGINLLLNHGANINHRDQSEGTALMQAANHNRINTVGVQLRHSIGRNTRNNFSRTALHSAAANHTWNTLKYFLDKIQIMISMPKVPTEVPRSIMFTALDSLSEPSS